MSSDSPDKNPEDNNVGVYICHCGGNISDHVDVQQLAQNVEGIDGVSVTHTNMFMCSDPGQELIQEDIKNGKIDRVVVASCAPSLHEVTFRGAIKRARMNPYLYEHANIREQVSWVHHGESATDKAVSLVAAAIAKAKNLEPLDPVRVDANNHATVIGAGVAGMRAALDVSRRGINVTLVEKSTYLGGRTAQLTRLAPTDETAVNIITPLAEAVCQDPRITVLTRTEVAGFEGYVGNFKLTLRRAPSSASNGDVPGSYMPFAGYLPPSSSNEGGDQTIQTGVIVFATGFKPYEPQENEFGYLTHPEVMTLPDFIRQTAENAATGRELKIQGRVIRRVAFIHCVGSRQIPGIHEPPPGANLNEYCSRTCCSAILRAAVEIRENYPDTHVFDYYRDIRTYGRGQEAYYDRAAEHNVMFFRFEPDAPPIIERSNNGRHSLKIRVKDTLTFGEELTAEVDLVVLAVGMEAQPITDLVEMMKLPTGMDGFLQEVHPKLRPVEVANNGILLAGTCQAPFDVSEACAAAQAAAVKTAALLARGYVELDPYVAEVNPERCTGNGKCKDVCPVTGAIQCDPAENGQATVNPALCTGCGICVAECPEQAIDIKGWTLKQYEDMVDAILAA
jgi:heterodisulfide reductase subunit A